MAKLELFFALPVTLLGKISRLLRSLLRRLSIRVRTFEAVGAFYFRLLYSVDCSDWFYSACIRGMSSSASKGFSNSLRDPRSHGI